MRSLLLERNTAQRLCLFMACLSPLIACDDLPLRAGSESHKPSTPALDAPNVCDVVERVFTPNCAVCHGEGGVYPDLTQNGALELLDATSQRYGDVPLLVANDVEGSLLYRKISGTQSADEGSSMPMGAPLDNESVELVANWIEGGATMDCSGPTSLDGGVPGGETVEAGTGSRDAGAIAPVADGGSGSSSAQTITLCDVDALLFAPKCVSCHGANGQAPDLSPQGALSSLVGVEGAGGVVRVVPGDASASLLFQKLDGSAAGSRMPLGGMATQEEIERVRDWINQGATLDCSTTTDADPPMQEDAGNEGMTMPPPHDPTPVCSSGEYWTGGNHGSERMHPGLACLACHQNLSNDEDTPSLWVGGTVYPTLHEPDDCLGADGEDAFEGAIVRLTDALGIEHNLPVNRSGNFMLDRDDAPDFAMPFNASLWYQNRERPMHSAQQSGDCNSCHTTQGANGAPGRIYLP